LSPLVRVVNTAPLIFLSKIKRLELLRLGADAVYTPSEVLNELKAVQDDAGMAVQEVLGTWLLEKSCSQQNLLAISRQALDPGEAEVVALALELGTRDVVLDDLDARRFARRSGLQPIGTLGLLLAGKQAGIIQTVSTEINALQRVGLYANAALVTRILSEAGEE
jgi:predicted nucleic acid-binding protein